MSRLILANALRAPLLSSLRDEAGQAVFTKGFNQLSQGY